MNSLNARRNSSILTVISVTLANAGGAAVPTPGLETGKHAVFSAAEIGMCVAIYNIYFSENISKDKMEVFLINNGIAVASGGGIAYLATKMGHLALAEILNFVPVIGWGIKAILAGSITATIGSSCIAACHKIAENGLNMIPD